METKYISHFISNNITKLFGKLPNGESVHSCKLINDNGMEVHIINYGATITAIKIPLQNGTTIDTVLGFDNLSGYVDSFAGLDAPYYGATVGRYAGRIKDGKFSLNETNFQLSTNNNNNTLHGGINNFSQKVWDLIDIKEGGLPSVKMRLISPDNDEHFPAELTIEVVYALNNQNELLVSYHATANADTIINLTNHSYFNLDGHNASVATQDLTIYSDEMLETTETNIPTGKIVATTNGPFDFTSARKCPTTIDNTFIAPKYNEVAAILYSPNNKLQMTVHTTQPGVHVYVGGACKAGLNTKNGAAYHSRSGICFETQNYPDAPNHSNFPSAILKKGAVYHHKTSYKFQSF